MDRADNQAERIVHPDVESLYSSGYTPNLGSVQDSTSESEIDLDRPCTSLSPSTLPSSLSGEAG